MVTLQQGQGGGGCEQRPVEPVQGVSGGDIQEVELGVAGCVVCRSR